MKITNLNYTYPVLSNHNNDYPNSEFTVEYTSTILDSSRAIKIEVQFENEEIQEILNQGIASLVAHIECPLTSYRKIIKLEDYSAVIPISDGDFLSRVEVNTFIISNDYIRELILNSVNPEIFGRNYKLKTIEKGTILATDITQIIDITLEQDSVFKEVSSIIKVGPNTENEYMEIDYEQDFILVKLPINQFVSYQELSGTPLSSLILSSTILPVLVNVISIMPEFNDIELDWYKVIEEKINYFGFKINDIDSSVNSLYLAQQILNNPILFSLDTDILGGQNGE